MTSLFTHLIPIALGFLAKLMAIKSRQAHDEQKLMLQALSAKSVEIDKARDQSNKESSMAAWKVSYCSYTSSSSYISSCWYLWY